MIRRRYSVSSGNDFTPLSKDGVIILSHLNETFAFDLNLPPGYFPSRKQYGQTRNSQLRHDGSLT